jgi:hypothetical protein
MALAQNQIGPFGNGEFFQVQLHGTPQHRGRNSFPAQVFSAIIIMLWGGDKVCKDFGGERGKGEEAKINY